MTQVFSDEGQSSETLDRPELRRLISAIEGGQVDRLIIYSIDRLSRRLFHFQELLELFEKHDVELNHPWRMPKQTLQSDSGNLFELASLGVRKIK